MTTSVPMARAEFDRCIEEHQHFVFSLAFRILRDYHAAEDVTQEAFALFYAEMDGKKRINGTAAWLGRVAVNLCRNRLSRDAIMSRQLVAVDAAETVVAKEGLTPEQKELIDSIRERARALPPQQKLCFDLHAAGFGQEEIGAILGTTSETVRQYWQIIVRKLRNGNA